MEGERLFKVRWFVMMSLPPLAGIWMDGLFTKVGATVFVVVIAICACVMGKLLDEYEKLSR